MGAVDGLRIVCERGGGPEVLVARAARIEDPARGEVRVRHAAIGVNYLDVYMRSGLYPGPLPFVPGVEAAGVVDAVGPEGDGGVRWMVGDRVVYATMPAGAYSTHRTLDARRLVRVPDGLGFDAAAATLLKGMSAHYLLHDSCAVKAGDALLVHAATGGVGSLLVPWAKHLGARVLAVVGTPAKVERARTLGADEVLVASRDDLVAGALAFTGGRGVDCVYDSVGKDTFARSLECLRPRGVLVSYGQSSGAVPPLDVLQLGRKSLFLTRPSLWDHVAGREELERRAGELHRLLLAGVLRADVDRVLPLAEARAAHEALEARSSAGSTLLRP